MLVCDKNMGIFFVDMSSYLKDLPVDEVIYFVAKVHFPTKV